MIDYRTISGSLVLLVMSLVAVHFDWEILGSVRDNDV